MTELLTILQGDALTVLRELPDASAQCCVTSPPYWGLRDYGCEGQLGLEKTPDEYVAKMVALFREVRRVIADDGTLWLNLGDSYGATGGDTHSGFNQRWSGTGGEGSKQDAMLNGVKDRIAATGLRPKNLIGIPWRVAFAMQSDGWYLRSDIIWSKPNPMPESVTDRPTKAHEYLFLMSKSERYFYDAAAIMEPSSTGDMRRPYGSLGSWELDGRPVEQRPNGKPRKTWDERKANGEPVRHGLKGAAACGAGGFGGEERNKRSVWTVATAPFPDAHFATYPPDLIKPCILAGSRPGDVVLDPFGGSGTTGMVALELGRKAVLIELNPAYVELIKRRCNVTPGLPFA